MTVLKCCTAVLNCDDKSINDHKRGQVDMYAESSILGLCLTTRMKGQLTATLKKDGSDAWYVDWAQIRLTRGNSFTCMFNNVLEN